MPVYASYRGSLALLPNVRLHQVLSLYVAHRSLASETPTNLADGDVSPEAGVHFTLRDRDLTYDVAGAVSIHFPTQFEAFLSSLTEMAEGGWVSFENPTDDGDDVPVFRGATHLAATEAKVAYYRDLLQDARQALEAAAGELEAAKTKDVQRRRALH